MGQDGEDAVVVDEQQLSTCINSLYFLCLSTLSSYNTAVPLLSLHICVVV